MIYWGGGGGVGGNISKDWKRVNKTGGGWKNFEQRRELRGEHRPEKGT